VTPLTCRTIDVIRGGAHDGPGLRTTVFLKGCSLSCRWCQNPEGIAATQEVWWESRKCIRCLACVEACPNTALSASDEGLQLDREKCVVCGACVPACPALAMTFTGHEWTLDALLKKVRKDQDYYQAFGGGVTVSGGEPLCQYPFVAEFLRRLQAVGVHTALDTCGHVTSDAFTAVLPHTDHVLFDLKLLDPIQHQECTGQTNQRILANLLAVANHIRNPTSPATKLWIRTPLIPGATATAGNIAAIGRFIHEHLLDVVERWELCAFNSACHTKYEKLGCHWPYADRPLLTQRTVADLQDAALSAGIPAETLVVSGLIAKDGAPSQSCIP
jgi:pyruvate formate lyase activating enzyme